MKDPIKFVHLNGLEYNPNRDPQFYRRLPGQPFVVQVALRGEGTVTARFAVDDKVVAEKSFALPGKFECEVSFDSPGSRIGKLTVEAGGQSLERDLRLDVMDHAWVG